MVSIVGKTKEVDCISCGKNKITMSLYASSKSAICENCGGKNDLTHTISSAPISEPISEISKPAKDYIVRPMTKDMKKIREMIREELEQYSLWEWREISVKDFTLKQLNIFGEKGWRFAFTSEDGRVLLHRIKK